MPFFEFRQNNSGGSFVEDDSLSVTVIIEANDSIEANARAKSIGIYFNGVDNNVDCPCCGDRWHEQNDDTKGDKEPSLYGVPINTALSEEYCKETGISPFLWTNKAAIIHYQDHTVTVNWPEWLRREQASFIEDVHSSLM